MPDYITIYTDASVSGPAYGPMGWAAFCPDTGQIESGHLNVPTTNNFAEVFAIYMALLYLAEPKDKVLIVTDSKFVRGWLVHHTRKRHTLEGDNKNILNEIVYVAAIKNLALWTPEEVHKTGYDDVLPALRASRNHYRLAVAWVKGHGHSWANNLVDAVAVRARRYAQALLK